MKMRYRIQCKTAAERLPPLCLATVLCLFANLGAAGFETAGEDSLELRRAFKKMDAVAGSFRTFVSDFTQNTYTAILEEFGAPQEGMYFYALDKDGSALWRHETTSPAKRILTVKKGTATIYQPGIKQATIYNLGARREYVEYLAVGIGKSSKELQEKFDVSYQGTECIGDSPCFVLFCRPKDPEVAAQVSSITIWLKKSSGTPSQFKIESPSGDYVLETFSNEKLNVGIPDSKFEQKLPKGIDIIKIQ